MKIGPCIDHLPISKLLQVILSYQRVNISVSTISFSPAMLVVWGIEQSRRDDLEAPQHAREVWGQENQSKWEYGYTLESFDS